jgi:hypothetical protein
MTTLKKLVKQINAENAPPDGWTKQDQVAAVEETVPHVDVLEANKEDKPEEGKVYALTGGPGSRCIANGNTWVESEVIDSDPAAGSSRDRGNY